MIRAIVVKRDDCGRRPNLPKVLSVWHDSHDGNRLEGKVRNLQLPRLENIL